MGSMDLCHGHPDLLFPSLVGGSRRPCPLRPAGRLCYEQAGGRVCSAFGVAGFVPPATGSTRPPAISVRWVLLSGLRRPQDATSVLARALLLARAVKGASSREKGRCWCPSVAPGGSSAAHAQRLHGRIRWLPGGGGHSTHAAPAARKAAASRLHRPPTCLAATTLGVARAVLQQQ